MPAVTSTTTEEQNDPDQRMWNALKWHISRERQRKKQEYEAEVEEERLRKEREARERQDVMTLEQKLKQLEKEKQQLFMKLKKVLNEDENRKRQQQKESNENQPIKMQMGNIQQMPMFPMSSSTGQGEPIPTQGRPPPLTSHMLNKQTIVRGPIQAGTKRARSPSPTYALYSQRLHQPPMKHQPVYSDHRVVVGERPPPLLYAHHAHTPHTPHTPHHANLMYAPAPQPQLYLDILKNREGQQHQEPKKESQTSKPGSITQGYPVQQSNPNVQNPNIYPNRHRY
ncbi:hypothetical protein MSG28_007706 [Choristoneura fumiferana]|uniref:Uncharacterized protein n=1 Tax=Choristoneura fumiferana TaxID=7141 RepID=A0ACC0JY46_CHOFU|nr:hypothetical protein MSG28_007706 [Choristoneura fumiferana]